MTHRPGYLARRALLVVCVAMPFAFGSCAPFQNGAGFRDDPMDRVDWAMLGGPRGSRALRGGSFAVTPAPPRPPGPAHVPGDKLHPQLLALLGGPPGTVVEVLVTFRDTLTIPRFPERLPATDPKAPDRDQAIADLIQQIRNQRTADYDTLDDSLAVYGTIQERDSHWLQRAMLMEVPVQNLLPLAAPIRR